VRQLPPPSFKNNLWQRIAQPESDKLRAFTHVEMRQIAPAVPTDMPFLHQPTSSNKSVFIRWERLAGSAGIPAR